MRISWRDGKWAILPQFEAAREFYESLALEPKYEWLVDWNHDGEIDVQIDESFETIKLNLSIYER